MPIKDHAEELELIQEINESADNGKVASTKLETDEKVLARVTDGIYRLPGSALRELVSNSYDADAENVTIYTDVPRFESMTVRDDGNGMSIETLVNLIGHIGGSAKRSNKGRESGVTDAEDETISPKKKRKLIGKIGIGLFSVAQLTRHFEIVTKQEGNDFYLKAKVRLYNYSEEYLRKEEKTAVNSERGVSFETGDVDIWIEKTENSEAHGTDIILHDIKSSASDLLKSVDVWGQETAETEESDESKDDFMNSSKLELPTFHVGCLSGEDGYEYFNENKNRTPNLPWEDKDKEDEKFSKLYDAILSLTKSRVNPKLNVVLDNYLNMIWTLALSVPLNYIDKHPFKLSLSDVPDVYAISNKLKGQAEQIVRADRAEAFTDYIPLLTNSDDIDFNVTIDGIKLFRPIRFTDLPESTAIVKKPIMFLGAYSPDLSSMDIHDSAGELAFDAYLLWSPKVVPKDHNGVLVRLHNSSGIMFDETFMKHQVAEHTIKSQLTVEIFVNKGLDSALNIDRESFNISHPHYQIVMRWLHQAIRQVINRYKTIKKELTAESRVRGQSVLVEKLSEHVDGRLNAQGLDPDEKPQLEIIDNGSLSTGVTDSFGISKQQFSESTGFSNIQTQKSHSVVAKAEALLQILDAHGLLDNISPTQQNDLLMDLLKVLSTEV